MNESAGALDPCPDPASDGRDLKLHSQRLGLGLNGSSHLFAFDIRQITVVGDLRCDLLLQIPRVSRVLDRVHQHGHGLVTFGSLDLITLALDHLNHRCKRHGTTTESAVRLEAAPSVAAIRLTAVLTTVLEHLVPQCEAFFASVELVIQGLADLDPVLVVHIEIKVGRDLITHLVLVPVIQWCPVQSKLKISGVACHHSTRHRLAPYSFDQPVEGLHFVRHIDVSFAHAPAGHGEVSTFAVQLDTDFLLGATAVEVRLGEKLDAGAAWRHLCVSFDLLQHLCRKLVQLTCVRVPAVVEVDALNVGPESDADAIEVADHPCIERVFVAAPRSRVGRRCGNAIALERDLGPHRLAVWLCLFYVAPEKPTVDCLERIRYRRWLHCQRFWFCIHHIFL